MEQQKSNDPTDLHREQQTGLATSNQMAAHHARDPHVPSKDIQNNLEQPLVCLPSSVMQYLIKSSVLSLGKS